MRQPMMMPVLFAATLFFQCYALAAAAIPVSKGDDGGVSSLEQEALNSLLLDEEAAEVAGDDPRMASSRSGGPRVIMMMADAAALKKLRALDRGLSFYKQQQQQQQQQRPGDNDLPPERREPAPGLGPEPSMALLKRDTMRCMVGRVYRPCWEA